MYLYDIVSRFRIRKTVGARKAARCTADAILRGFFFLGFFSILFLFFFIFFVIPGGRVCTIMGW